MHHVTHSILFELMFDYKNAYADKIKYVVESAAQLDHKCNYCCNSGNPWNLVSEVN